MNLNSDSKKLDLYSQTDQDFISAHSPLVIYDSSLSYLYHRAISGYKGKYLKPFHEILILDKTDSYYNESINEWNKEFTNVDYKLDNIVCPDGVEIAFSKGIFYD